MSVGVVTRIRLRRVAWRGCDKWTPLCVQGMQCGGVPRGGAGVSRGGQHGERATLHGRGARVEFECVRYTAKPASPAIAAVLSNAVFYCIEAIPPGPLQTTLSRSAWDAALRCRCDRLGFLGGVGAPGSTLETCATVAVGEVNFSEIENSDKVTKHRIRDSLRTHRPRRRNRHRSRARRRCPDGFADCGVGLLGWRL